MTAKTRLLVGDREAIRNAVVAHKFVPLTKALAASEAKLAKEAYERLYDKPTRAAMRRLPDGAFAQRNSIKVGCAGQNQGDGSVAAEPLPVAMAEVIATPSVRDVLAARLGRALEEYAKANNLSPADMLEAARSLLLHQPGDATPSGEGK